MPNCVKPGEVTVYMRIDCFVRLPLLWVKILQMFNSKIRRVDLVLQVYPDFSESGSFKQVTSLHSQNYLS